MKTSTHESDRPEFTPLIFTATRRQDYNWYAQQGSALVALEDAPRALLPAIERLSITQPVSCASLFRYQTADGLCCAVAWSGIRRGEVDHIGRGLLYSLLVDFRADQTAACFYAGLLKDWWPNRKEGVLELSQYIGEALSGAATAVTIDHYLARTIAEWATFVPRPTPILQQKHSLGARLSPKLVEDLASFIFSVAKQPQILPAPQKDFQPLAIVSDDLAPQRADGCWRVLLGQAGSANWAPVANNANPSPLPQPKPFNQRAAQPRLRPDSASRQETSLPFPLDLLRAVANALFELLRRLPFGRSSSVGRDTLQHALQQRDYRLVRQNIVVIAAAGRQAPQQIVEPLAKSLNLASDPEWQIVCCDLLAKIGPAAAGATDALEQLQQHGTDKVRPYAANALREIRRSSQPTPKALPVGEVDHDE